MFYYDRQYRPPVGHPGAAEPDLPLEAPLFRGLRGDLRRLRRAHPGREVLLPGQGIGSSVREA